MHSSISLQHATNEAEKLAKDKELSEKKAAEIEALFKEAQSELEQRLKENVELEKARKADIKNAEDTAPIQTVLL